MGSWSDMGVGVQDGPSGDSRRVKKTYNKES